MLLRIRNQPLLLIPDALGIAKHCEFARDAFNHTFDVFYLVWLPFDICSIAYI